MCWWRWMGVYTNYTTRCWTMTYNMWWRSQHISSLFLLFYALFLALSKIKTQTPTKNWTEEKNKKVTTAHARTLTFFFNGWRWRVCEAVRGLNRFSAILQYFFRGFSFFFFLASSLLDSATLYVWSFSFECRFHLITSTAKLNKTFLFSFSLSHSHRFCLFYFILLFYSYCLSKIILCKIKLLFFVYIFFQLLCVSVQFIQTKSVRNKMTRKLIQWNRGEKMAKKVK